MGKKPMFLKIDVKKAEEMNDGANPQEEEGKTPMPSKNRFGCVFSQVTETIFVSGKVLPSP